MTAPKMPELPQPDLRVSAFGELQPTDRRPFVMGDFFTADQMHSMYLQGRREALEEAAATCEGLSLSKRWADADECAAAIRELSKEKDHG